MRLRRAAIALAALAGAAPAAAQPVEPLAARFGARAGLLDASLAPDGARIVMIVPRDGGGENAVVIEVANGKPTPILSTAEPGQHLAGCRFVLADRVVCEVTAARGSGASVETISRLYVVGSDGKGLRMLTARTPSRGFYEAHYGGEVVDYNVPGKPDSVLLVREFVPQRASFRIAQQIGFGVEEVDLRTFERHTVVPPLRTASRFISDGAGRVRIAALATPADTGFAGLTTNYMSRPREGGRWSDLSAVKTVSGGLSAGFEPVAVDPASDTAVGFDADRNGRTGLYRLALDGSGSRQPVLVRDDADVDQLLRIGRSQRIIGASFATERRVVEYFDPAYRSLAAALAKVLGGRQVSLVDASADERKLLVLASSDTDPGMLYLYDRDSHTLAEVVPVRDALAGFRGAPMQPVTYTAADGTAIPAYLTVPLGSAGKGLPAIVLPHGGPSARDEWGFDWLAQYFVARGFAVLQPQFRGSTGYGAEWFRKNGFQSWRTAIGDVNDAGRWLLKEGIVAPGKLAILGWSYGGYAALQSAVLDPDLFKAIVAIAPVTDLDALRDEARNRYDYIQVDSFIGQGPHVAEGSPARHAGRFKAPVLLFHGDMDTNVRQDQSRLMADRLKAAGKAVTYVPFKGLDHEIDDAAARTRMLGDSEAFIRQALGIQIGAEQGQAARSSTERGSAISSVVSR